MPYTPPQVTTSVVIDSTIVSLPGGTRLLALIGEASKTKTILGEIHIQGSGLTADVNQTGLSSIISIYDFSGPGNSLVNYPTSGTGAFGSGYYISGETILWTEAVNPYPASSTPQAGSQFIVNYSGGGTQTLTQNSLYNVAISGTDVATVTNKLNTLTYPVSGTVTGFDSIGFGVTGTGWTLSGSSIVWGQATNDGFPSTTVVQSGASFFVDYNYTKSGSDYEPKNFVDQSRVVDEYGSEAYWTLITSGVNAGSYTLSRINPLTLGAKVAFLNNASVLTLVEISGTGLAGGDYLDPLSKLQEKSIDLIVPLTVGSGVTTNDMDVEERALALNYTKLHCETQSNSANQRERVGLGSLGAAEIGDDSTPNTYIYTAELGLNSKRMCLVAPGTAQIQLQDPAGVFQNVNIDGCFLAVAVAALSASSLIDVATPLTNQELNGFFDVSAGTINHPAHDYLTVEKNMLGGAGVLLIDQEGPRIFVRHQLTTDQSNVVNGELSVVTLIDFVSQAVRFACKGFIGKKLRPAQTIPAVKGAILATLSTLAGNDIISSIGGIKVSINPNNPTELLVEASYVPIFPLNRITVKFTIKTL